MRHLVIALGGAALLLGACGKKEETKTGPMSETEVKAAMANAPQLSPGKYEASMEVTKFDLPGVPAAQLAQMRQQMQTQMSVKRQYCMTADDARKGREDMLKQLSQARADCRFENFGVDGDKVNGRMTCGGGPGGATMTMTMQGTMGATASDITMDTHMTNPANPQQTADMGMHITTRRLGDCDGTEANSGQPEAAPAPAR